MQQTRRKRLFHLKMSYRLFLQLKETGQREGRSPRAQAEYYLGLVLPIVQEQSRYRIAPRELDFGPLTHELKPCLALESYDFLCDLAMSSGLSTNEQARELLWFVAERCRELYPKGGLLLLKEEFQKRIREYLSECFSKIQ